jgi:glycosyltransferase involved in cell wall biosynthesis
MVSSWAINGRFLTQPVSGVQRYAHEVVRALDAVLASGHPSARNVELELIAPPGTTFPPGLSAITTRTAGNANGHLWEQYCLPAQAKHGLLSLCNSGPILKRKQIVCIHDVNTRTCPESYSLRFRALHKVLLPAIGRSVATVTTVSRHSSRELVEHAICPPGKIVVATNGHEHALRWSPRHSPSTISAAGPRTIVVIGSPAPHKNVGLIVGMAERLAADGFSLAVVGNADPRVFSTTPASGGAGNVHRLGRLSDDEMAALLRDSLCLAFPSLSEGFGLPALEAMALGCPVVASRRASLPEVCADAALYASPLNSEEWLECFRRLGESAALRRTLVDRGAKRAAAFRWRDTAATYLAEINRLDGIAVAEEGSARGCRSRRIAKDRLHIDA